MTRNVRYSAIKGTFHLLCTVGDSETANENDRLITEFISTVC